MGAMGICDGRPADILCRLADIMFRPSVFLYQKSIQIQKKIAHHPIEIIENALNRLYIHES
jgi:hypothetical protein